MDVSGMLMSGFIKADTVANGPVRGVIANVAPGKFERPDMELQDGGTLGLNATNLRTLSAAWGPETNEWIGKEVELYLGKTVYMGKEQDSVLVKAISPATPWRSRTGAPAGSQSRQKELDDDIPF
jgi:hypothetical protein